MYPILELHENVISLHYVKDIFQTSGQNGGVGRHTSPPHTTTKRITTNVQTENTQDYQKTELYGSPINKDLKNPYSSRRVGGVELWSQD